MSQKTQHTTATSLPSQEEWRNIFKDLDENGDGKVSVKRLGHGLRLAGLNHTEKELDTIIRTTPLDCKYDL